MTISDSTESPTTPPWYWVVSAITLRLRFILATAAVGFLITAWPWLVVVWERSTARWTNRNEAFAVSSDAEFFCPMDPGIVSAWPAICPICNMDLIGRKKVDAVLLPEGVLARMQLSPYRVQLAGVRTEEVHAENMTSTELAVPVSAVVHRENGPIVYIETMPGTFDAMPVELGTREGDRYLVMSGLKAQQRVVTVGVFLIDAESRLNPSLATQYFGAHQHNSTSAPPTLAKQAKKQGQVELSEWERQLVLQQEICPVTGAALGSMGQPVIVTVDGRKVALCCRGCEGRFFAAKDRYLEKIPLPKSTVDAPP